MAEQITIRIFHNENERQSFVHGYSIGDPLKEVYCGEHRLLYKEASGINLSLEYIFEENQWLDHRRPWYDGARSLSVGDVIVIGRRAFSVCNVGFGEIDPAEAGLEIQV
jgi:hypothetical protein